MSVLRGQMIKIKCAILYLKLKMDKRYFDIKTNLFFFKLIFSDLKRGKTEFYCKKLLSEAHALEITALKLFT